MYKLLFTKLELFLIRNQARPFVIDKKVKPVAQDRGTQLSRETFESQKNVSKYYKKLLEGVYDSETRRRITESRESNIDTQ